MGDAIPSGWRTLLPDGCADEALHRVARERRDGMQVFPPEGLIFSSLELTPPEVVKAVILGQDPYHGPGQACGLAFAVPPGCTPLPPSLKNILKELQSDLGLPIPQRPDLRRWARQGVLLLNTVLSVRAREPLSHADFGWQAVTNAVVRAVNAFPRRVVFLLWGNNAAAYAKFIDATRHALIVSAHPSPLSARRGFFGSRPFSRANAALAEAGIAPIDWSL